MILRRILYRHVAALMFFALVSVAATYPMILHFTSAVLGTIDADHAQNLWNLWWIKRALIDQPSNPFHTDLLFYPQGAYLYLHTLDIPALLLALVPQLVFGLIAGFNSTVLTALMLSGYAGFRLAYYLTRHYTAALLAGVLIGFSPLMYNLVYGQVNVVSIQWLVLCLEFYLRAWDTGKRVYALAAGAWFSLAVLTVAYFEIYLIIFFVVHIIWVGFSARRQGWRTVLHMLRPRVGSLLLWAGAITALLVGPYVLATFLTLPAAHVANPSFPVGAGLSHSADLLSFFVPPPSSWLLSRVTLAAHGIDPRISRFAFVGLAGSGLAAVGAVSGRRTPRTALWVTVAGVSAVLAMGPFLQINGASSFAGSRIPLPFSFFQRFPPFNFIHFPERFTTLLYVAIGILAAEGLRALLSQRSLRRQILTWLIVAGTVLAGFPFGPQPVSALSIPASFQVLARGPNPGPLLELPVKKQGSITAPRQLNQIVHALPIQGGYLSRDVLDPREDTCSPLLLLGTYPRISADDIVSPSAVTQLPALVSLAGMQYIAVYKVDPDPGDFSRLLPTPPELLGALQSLAGRLGRLIADDPQVSVYAISGPAPAIDSTIQLGSGWNEGEHGPDGRFRWMNGAQAEFCVFNPAPRRLRLAMTATSFYQPRHLQLWLGDRLVAGAVVASDGQYHTFYTPAIDWPAGPQLVRIVVPEGAISPVDVRVGQDSRSLSLAFQRIALDIGP